jgi:hypothetical protein
MVCEVVMGVSFAQVCSVWLRLAGVCSVCVFLLLFR